jgi:DNA polymerase-4
VSIGLSFNKFLAKTASDLDKPRGFSIIGKGEALDFLGPRSVATLPGVGPAGAKALAKHGYHAIGDLRAAGAMTLQAKLGEWGARLYDYSIAHDPRRVDADGERKTISAETTFFEDMAQRDWLEDVLWDLCEKVAARARANHVGGRTITLKLRRADFKIITRRRQLGEATLLAARLFEIGRTLLSVEADGRTQFRLIGIGLSDFEDAANADQGDMLDTETPKRAATEDAIAKARAKFGNDAVLSGRSLKRRDGE